jgi:DivIVA domain-containing protein
VEFREKMRGYHPEDVDQFLEQVAAGLEVMQDRLRQAVERAQRAEAAAADAGGSDETLKRTLVLAQRTADLAIQEAREQAARILAGAEQQAQSLLAEAEEKARRTTDDALAGVRAEVGNLESARLRISAEVEGLNRWVEDNRTRLTGTLHEAMSSLERIGKLPPPPGGPPSDPPKGRTARGSSMTAPVSSAGAESAADQGDEPDQDTLAWHPAAATASVGSNASMAGGRGRSGIPEGETLVADPPPSNLADADIRELSPERQIGPDEQALDDFFEDGEFEDERRFGGRLRRRR